MVDAVVGSAINKLGEYLLQEGSLLLGVKDEVQWLKEDLACLQGLLKDAMEDDSEKSNAFSVWIEQCRDIAYEAEDILDAYLLKVEERDKSKRMFLDLIKKFCFTPRHEIAKDIKSLKEKINDLSRKFETYCNKNIGSRKASNSNLRRLKEIRRAPSVIEEEHVVGVEDDADILLQQLLKKDSRTYMISIFGPGGLGKTALARKLYNSIEAKRRFDYRGWTCISQEYNTRDVLQSIIKSFQSVSASELEMINRKTMEDLERYIRTLLEGKRYLVVVDDIWEKEAWESLKRSFPRSVDGSRVIMTTRIRSVAESADDEVYVHNLRHLTFDESWELFQRKAFRDQPRVSSDLEELGRDMVKKCRGLPLAIIVLAGVLRKKENKEWYEVHDHIWRSLREDSIQISGLLNLSFNYLYYELKLCFLYLGIFPEDFEINVQTLIQLLVAEGFIQEDEDGKILEDLAECYIHELMDKSLVQVGKRSRGKIVTCRVHDLLRDLAIRMAKELNFINVNGGYTLSSTCRREVIHCSRGKDIAASSLNTRMRSLFLYGERWGNTYLAEHDEEIICKNLKFLRVLDFGRIFEVSSLPLVNISSGSSLKAIGKLIHLRYLGLPTYFPSNFEAHFSNLRYLRTLDASRTIFKERVDLSKLTSLKHIYGVFQGELLMGNATKLQTLDRVTTPSWNRMRKNNLINLRKLVINNLSLIMEERHVSVEMRSFSNLKNLLTLESDAYKLDLSSPAEYPPKLESLTLRPRKLQEDPMPLLEKLPRLQHLALEVQQYPRKKLICSAKGFPWLKHLMLDIRGLKEVHIEDDAMPNLVEWVHVFRNTMFYGREGDDTNFMIPERLKAIKKERRY